MSPSGDSFVISLDYIAGLFDGEGCISCTRQFVKGKYEKYPRISIQITISNNEKLILDLVENWFSGDVTRKSKNSDCYHWRVTGKSGMLRFLTRIKDRVFIKKPQVLEAIRFCETLRSENLGCVPLNKKEHKLRKDVYYNLMRMKKEFS